MAVIPKVTKNMTLGFDSETCLFDNNNTGLAGPNRAPP